MRQAHRPLVRRQLLALLMVLCLPYLLVIGLSTHRQARNDRELAGNNMLEAALATSARLDDYVGDLSQILSMLALVVGTERADIARNDALLRDLSEQLPPHIQNLNIWAADGTNIGALRPQVRASGMVVSERKFFRDAADRPGLSLEAPLVSTINGQQIGIFGLRIEREGRFAGVISVATQLRHLHDLLAPAGSLPRDTIVTVMDERGVVLARSSEPELFIGKPSSVSSMAQQDRERRRGKREGTGADGVERIYGFTIAGRVPWLVRVAQPMSEALDASRSRLLEQIGIGGVLMIVGLLLAGVISERIARPLRQLEEDAAAIEDGELSRRTAVTGSGEIGSLATTFNRMARSLEQRTLALASSEERLRRLAEFDALTGLANRSLFIERLQARVEQATRECSGFALLFIDIDHFKAVNDTHGHRAGDQLLVSFARALEGGVGPDDTVARLSGDEFIVMLDAVVDLDRPRPWRSALSKP